MSDTANRKITKMNLYGLISGYFQWILWVLCPDLLIVSGLTLLGFWAGEWVKFLFGGKVRKPVKRN